MPLTQNIKERLDSWLHMLIEANGADLHIKSGSQIHARVKSDIVLLSNEKLDTKSIEELVKMLTGDAYDEFLKTKEFDGAYGLDENYRFRINIFMHLTGFALAFRLIPSYIKTIEELNLPAALHKLTHLRRGLVLVTGTTGSGKSTTLSSVIEEINKIYPRHIITVEDPIEYVHNDIQSIVEQRELGLHTTSFSRALRAAMREDPDIIVVGEMRDIATAESILQAVNTGHLVFSTVHTLDARETVDRIIAIFPNEEQNRVRETLAATLEAVISQRLIRSTSGEMIPAVEMMFKSPQIQELIRKKRDHEIPDALEKEHTSYGSISFNHALFDLALAEKITEEQAYQYASSPADLKLMFTVSTEYEEKFHPESKGDAPLLKEE
ncbi:type IV pilus twitching motility protein PilT [Sulfurovum sp. TSL1]|uniref:type IV pilus twitching motility protein PilT n=1 Tax=Sulfurovum sp. TSL1 TaxID=2826994 RepID=UPI001CC39584|nr:PilT/PilU family type 4a pilus ATPase [Sulfurovum sp. TSL1]GIT97651.1 twitching motility protein PilT [Sulfurovum sp. TSL1]